MNLVSQNNGKPASTGHTNILNQQRTLKINNAHAILAQAVTENNRGKTQFFQKYTLFDPKRNLILFLEVRLAMTYSRMQRPAYYHRRWWA